MRIYEEVFILDSQAADEQIDAVVAQIEEVVKEGGGSSRQGRQLGCPQARLQGQEADRGAVHSGAVHGGRQDRASEIERRLRVDES